MRLEHSTANICFPPCEHMSCHLHFVSFATFRPNCRTMLQAVGAATGGSPALANFQEKIGELHVNETHGPSCGYNTFELASLESQHYIANWNRFYNKQQQ